MFFLMRFQVPYLLSPLPTGYFRHGKPSKQVLCHLQVCLLKVKMMSAPTAHLS